MKRNLLNSTCTILLGGTALLFSACSQNNETSEKVSVTETSEEHSGHDMQMNSANQMMDLMHENMAEMQKVEMTGDADHDFAKMMAMHHQGALSMAQAQVDKGKDTILLSMAKVTLREQKLEQDKLQNFVSNHQPTPGNKEAGMEMMESMKSTMSKMDNGKSGTTDHQFALLMGMHHQSGIDMAKAYLPHAKEPEMKALAQKIIDDQQEEKIIFDAWLADHPN